jgi:hypothetical protein
VEGAAASACAVKAVPRRISRSNFFSMVLYICF